MILGAHESVAGGLALAFERGRRDGCRALQIFTSSARQWRARRLFAAEVAAFRHQAAAARWPLLAHASYLINLGTDDRLLRRRSCETLYAEVARAESLGLDYVVLHPGSHGAAPLADGLARVAECLSAVHKRT